MMEDDLDFGTSMSLRELISFEAELPEPDPFNDSKPVCDARGKRKDIEKDSELIQPPPEGGDLSV